MARRGRPPHPGPLTPAEERVLECVRQGMPNAEIAVRLYVSVNTVRYHVSNLLAKAGVPSREELAQWEPDRSGDERRGARWWLPLALGKPVAIVALGAGVLVAGTLGLLAFAGDADTEPAAATITARSGVTPNPTVTDTVPVTPTATPTPPAQFTVRPSTLTPDIALLTLAVAEGSSIGIDRVSIDPLAPDPSSADAIVREPVWRAPIDEATGRPRAWGVPVADPTGSRIALMLQRGPGSDEFDLVAGDANGHFSDPVELDGRYIARFFAGDHVVLVPELGPPARNGLLFDPNTGAFEPFEPPEPATFGPIGWTQRHGMLWLAGGDAIDDAGRRVFSLDGLAPAPPASAYVVAMETDGYQNSVIRDGWMNLDEGLLLVRWSASDPNDRADGLDLVTEIWMGDGRVLSTYEGSFRPLGLSLRYGFAGAYLNSGGVELAATYAGGNPVLRTIGSPGVGDEARESSWMIGVQRGPFGRVRAGAPACAPLLASPAPDAVQVECAEPGDLLPMAELLVPTTYPVANTTEAGGSTYLQVRGADGDLAWVETEYIEYRPEFPELALR